MSAQPVPDPPQSALTHCAGRMYLAVHALISALTLDEVPTAAAGARSIAGDVDYARSTLAESGPMLTEAGYGALVATVHEVVQDVVAVRNVAWQSRLLPILDEMQRLSGAHLPLPLPPGLTDNR